MQKKKDKNRNFAQKIGTFSYIYLRLNVHCIYILF